KADIKRQGTDVTLFAVGKQVNTALEAAEQLSAKGIEAEVLDPRSLSPLDEEAILVSLEKTNRLIIIDEANPRCSIATDIAAFVADQGFDLLDAPIKRITAPHTPVPFSPVLEDIYLPTPDNIVNVTLELLGEPLAN
ncbi:transketolase C-terminal domain-containing protein, partial [Bacillus atrophaeus]|nr:alpha-ketoacid dehydrogenase subunit beta [Bacillus atrophaeus]